jgi:3-oxoacyl-[acyl-carrier-protein] synthase-3
LEAAPTLTPRTASRIERRLKGDLVPNAYISGTGGYVPPDVVTNDELATRFGIDTNDEWIHKRTGIRERRFAADGVGTADLAVEASKQAIERAGLTNQDIDMILFATLSPEHHFPGTGVYLQRKLGFCDGDNAKFVPCLDIRNQCSGFLYGLATASSMVQSGQVKHVLLVGSEVHSHALDLTTRGRQVSSLFGDGAGAVVVSPTEEDRGVRGWYLGADGRYADNLALRVWDIKKFPYVDQIDDKGVVEPRDMWPYMEGKVVFRHAVQRMCETLMEACMKHDLTRDDIDLFFFHQANLRINEYIVNMMGIDPEKVPFNIDRYGNTTAATIPLLLEEAERTGKLKRGMKVAMVAFGSGFTWGSAIVDW